MKTALLRTLPGESRTSMEVYATEMASALRGLGDPALQLDELNPHGVFRTGLAASRPLSRVGGLVDRYALYQLRALRVDADVVHIVDHGYGHLALSLGPRRCVVTFHDALLLRLHAGEIPGVDHRPRATILGHRLSLAGILRAARVIADSESARDDLVRLAGCDPARVRVVPLGVSPRFLALGQRRAQQASPARGGRPVRILSVGHCGPAKNIEGLLRALPRIGAAVEHPVTLVKVGAPFTAQQRDLIAQLGIGDMVEHRGRVSEDALLALYGSADLVLVPSHHEGFGLTALEAMACGTPVVASPAGSLPEVVGDAGVLAASTDADAIAGAAATVLCDPMLAAELRGRGLRRAATFTWERTARATLDVYREVAER
jgi:glycosyltransferase involved in cell wall biosynthesis